MEMYDDKTRNCTRICWLTSYCQLIINEILHICEIIHKKVNLPVYKFYGLCIIIFEFFE